MKDFKNNFGWKVRGPWPPWPLPFLPLRVDINEASLAGRYCTSNHHQLVSLATYITFRCFTFISLISPLPHHRVQWQSQHLGWHSFPPLTSTSSYVQYGRFVRVQTTDSSVPSYSDLCPTLYIFAFFANWHKFGMRVLRSHLFWTLASLSYLKCTYVGVM